MKTEKLKQNVKGYVQQFEDGGLRLLRKGQKGVIHAIFSRFGLVLILLLLQVGLLFSIFRWFGNLWPHYFGGSVVVTSAMVIYLLNSKMDNSAKITWMVVIAIAPVVGIPMFFYVKSNFGHNILRKRLLELEDQLRLLIKRYVHLQMTYTKLWLDIARPSEIELSLTYFAHIIERLDYLREWLSVQREETAAGREADYGFVSYETAGYTTLPTY